MNPWIFITTAVVANICCNVMLKKAMASITAPPGIEMAKQALSSGWFWGGGFAGGVLLISYLLAIRTIDLSVSYSIVTSAALIGISLSAVMFLNEPATPLKIAGVALIVFGISLIAKSQGT